MPNRLIFLVFFLAAAQITILSADSPQSGRQIYQNYCASCHGVSGAPDPVMAESLGVMPADFSDALFNSREGESEWRLVVTHGGPALGFSEVMPAFGEILSSDDINQVLSHIKTLGGEHDYPDGSLNLFLPVRTKKAFPEDEVVWKQRFTGQDGDNAWKNVLEYEFRVGQRWQGVLEVTHEKKGDSSDFGHFEPGFKYVLHHDVDRGMITTLGGNLGVPMNSDEPWEVLPYLAFGKILSDQWTLQGSGRLKLDVEDSDHSSAELAAIVHWVHSPWPRNVFPALEVVGEVPFERGSGADRKAAVQWSALPQVRIGLSKRGHVAVNAGVELPLNDRERYDWRAYVYLIWDFADGGFFAGW